MEYSIKPKRLGERRIIHYPQKRIIGLYVYNEEEQSLIKEYASQVKDMQKTKGLAMCICYQEKFGNQDVALAMITAREEIEEMKEIRHGKKI